MLYSVIVPVYNRPNEIDELLQSLTRQNFKDFEVLIIEDGSEEKCEHIAEKYSDQLDIHYFYKENTGQGFSRNFGFDRANGQYFLVFDSDCIIPENYFESVNQFLELNPVDCWGGPDKAHPSFTAMQKAINYSMTSFFTTGGIRGNEKRVSNFHPRSFNMGISRKVYETTGGYKITRMGEDLEFSIRIIKNGFRTALIPDAYVYHKRRTDFKQFYKQLHFFGRARINIHRFYPEELKGIHFIPVAFIAGIPLSILFILLSLPVLSKSFILYFLYAGLLFFDCLRKEKDIKISVMATIAGFIQLTAYGLGLIEELGLQSKTE